MTDMLGAAMGWIEEVRADFLVRSVVYRRGSATVTLDATVGQTTEKNAIENGIEVRVRMRDYLIAAQDLVLDGEMAEPKRGDRIEDTEGGVTRTYELMNPGAGEKEWRWSGSTHTRMRVHTKQISEEAA
jgi:hypothetical protein